MQNKLYNQRSEIKSSCTPNFPVKPFNPVFQSNLLKPNLPIQSSNQSSFFLTQDHFFLLVNHCYKIQIIKRYNLKMMISPKTKKLTTSK